MIKKLIESNLNSKIQFSDLPLYPAIKVFAFAMGSAFTKTSDLKEKYKEYIISFNKIEYKISNKKKQEVKIYKITSKNERYFVDLEKYITQQGTPELRSQYKEKKKNILTFFKILSHEKSHKIKLQALKQFFIYCPYGKNGDLIKNNSIINVCKLILLSKKNI